MIHIKPGSHGGMNIFHLKLCPYIYAFMIYAHIDRSIQACAYAYIYISLYGYLYI